MNSHQIPPLQQADWHAREQQRWQQVQEVRVQTPSPAALETIASGSMTHTLCSQNEYLNSNAGIASLLRSIGHPGGEAAMEQLHSNIMASGAAADTSESSEAISVAAAYIQATAKLPLNIKNVGLIAMQLLQAKRTMTSHNIHPAGQGHIEDAVTSLSPNKTSDSQQHWAATGPGQQQCTIETAVLGADTFGSAAHRTADIFQDEHPTLFLQQRSWSTSNSPIKFGSQTPLVSDAATPAAGTRASLPAAPRRSITFPHLGSSRVAAPRCPLDLASSGSAVSLLLSQRRRRLMCQVDGCGMELSGTINSCTAQYRVCARHMVVSQEGLADALAWLKLSCFFHMLNSKPADHNYQGCLLCKKQIRSRKLQWPIVFNWQAFAV